MIDKEKHRDKNLFALIANGDNQAFKQLFELYYDPIHRNALRLVKSDFWAEEIVQEVFLQVWANRHSLGGIESPSSWLYRLCANRCFDRLRKMSIEVRAQYVLANALIQQGNNAGLHPGFDFDRLQKLVKEAIDSLPAQQRGAFLLQFEEGLSYQEIARRMGISPNTVRNHLVRAVHSVRNYLIKHAPYLIPLFLFFYNYF